MTSIRTAGSRTAGVAALARTLALGLLLGAAFLLAACAGESDPDATLTTTATSTPPSSTGFTEPEETFAARSPDELDSYRYSVAVSVAASALDTAEAPLGLDLDGNLTLHLDGAVLNPDREQVTTAIDIGFLTLSTETIRVGDEEWTRSGQGAWAPSEPGAGPEDLFDGDFSPSAFFTTEESFSYEDLTQRLEAHGWADEEVNGVQARHFSFTEEEFYQVFETDEAVLPPDIDATFNADIWLAEDLGVPVRVMIVGVDGAEAEILRVEMNLTDLNAPLAIEPPV